MGEAEWKFYPDDTNKDWYWIAHSKCNSYMIWSNVCDCGEKVPEHIITQARLLSKPEDDFIEWQNTKDGVPPWKQSK